MQFGPSPLVFISMGATHNRKVGEASQTVKQQVTVHCLQPEAVWIPSLALISKGAGDNRKVGEAKRAKLRSGMLQCFACSQKQFGSPPLAFISMGAGDNRKVGEQSEPNCEAASRGALPAARSRLDPLP